tara:strand:+ start:543 stop:662 length:120 start_codon:yes stop_codon:yes gene_type:complete
MTDTKKKKNIYAKSLQNPKYRQRVVLNKKKYNRKDKNHE